MFLFYARYTIVGSVTDMEEKENTFVSTKWNRANNTITIAFLGAYGDLKVSIRRIASKYKYVEYCYILRVEYFRST